ncbi:Rrf2 family transcriptional regulator [Poseidonocella sp. HB161398]|uniref:RrF2 family transcriptional regulator n=1 Tax=Poseidonocella sp. HB161398 TaxID=2320855 RepID=UPI001108E398|nr:Rrf2 family transcriptional regulator [Poseidonocella sp. HB161398]
MRLTKFTDYAVRICLFLGMHQDRTVPIPEMAEAYGLSRNNLMKVAQRLAEGGFLRTERGRAGGVRLALPASEIRLGQVVRHMEGEGSLVDCGGCPPDSGCGLARTFTEARQAFYRTLDEVSLAEAAAAHAGAPAPKRAACA